MRWLLVVLVACACPSKPVSNNGSGSNAGSGSGSGTATRCDAVRGKIEALYREEAKVREPKRVEDAVADNTTMVMADCAKDPGKVVPCLNEVTTIADLEARCLVPLDEEGREGAELDK